MSDKPLITDEEYAKEVKSQSDYLNGVFGVSLIFLTIECLQFATPWHAAVICLGAVIPMYFLAFKNLPKTMTVLKELRKETNDDEVQKTIAYLERKFHGWRVIFTHFTLWFGLLIFTVVLFSAECPELVKWIKA